jgi:hypothetical protein
MADNGAYAFQWLLDRGYPPHQAAAVVGNLAQESGVRPDGVIGDNGTAFGVAQWRGDRFANLQRFAQQNGQDWRSLDAQLGFLDHELRGSEKGAGDALFASPDVRSATRAFIGFERPQGYTAENPEAGHGFGNRLSVAQAFLNGGSTALPTKSTTSKMPFESELSVSRKGTDDGSLGSALAMLAPGVGSGEEPLTPLVNQAKSGPFDEPIDVSAFQPRTTRRSSRRA